MIKTALIDTNILVYAYDTNSPTKQPKAVAILNELQKSATGFLSVKTLSEFFVVIRRIPNGLTTDEAIQEMLKLQATWPVLELTAAIAIEVARGVQTYQFSYWDAQLWATAKTHQINAVFTEDMRQGGIFDGVEIINPLDPAFNLTGWLNT